MGGELRAAIAGAGFIGTVHARCARLAGARLVAVSSSSQQSADAAAARLGAERSFASAEEMVEAEDVDVVHICTPNNLHVPLAAAALRAGKHVICEKPLALDAESAARLVSAAAEARTQATVPFVYRYYPTVREARERVRGGTTGPVRLLHGTYLQDWLLSADDHNWRVDRELGGPSRAFADIGSHWCDLAEFISGHRIKRLSALLATAHPERRRTGGATFAREGEAGGELLAVETEDAAVVQFETDGEALGTVTISQVSPGRKNRLWLELDGAEEAIAFDQESPEVLWCGRREAVTLVPRAPESLSAPAARYTTLPGGHPEGYAHCFEAFVAESYEAIRTGEPAEGLPLFGDGLRAAQITEAVLASAREQAWVAVAEAPAAPGDPDGGLMEVGG